VVDTAPPPDAAEAVGETLLLGSTGASTYEAFELELVRRQYRSWEMQASYTLSALRGNGDPYDAMLVEDGPLSDGSDGVLVHDRRHEVKLFATAFTPWGFRLGGTLRWLSGLPYSDLEQRIESPRLFAEYLIDNEGSPWPRQSYIGGLRNDQRNPSTWNVDLKVTKEINLGRAVNLRLSLEIYNLLDDRTYRIYNPGLEVGRTINAIDDANRRFGRRFELGMTLGF
jgi:outer membrane receptor protein involved in Fe transport